MAVHGRVLLHPIDAGQLSALGMAMAMGKGTVMEKLMVESDLEAN